MGIRKIVIGKDFMTEFPTRISNLKYSCIAKNVNHTKCVLTLLNIISYIRILTFESCVDLLKQ